MDLRFLRTETIIKEKFIEQLSAMSFHEMTVTKLAKASMIDRTTFYTHYASTFELASALIMDYLAPFKNAFELSQKQRHLQSHFDSYHFFSDELVDYLLQNKHDIQLLREISLGKNSFDPQLRQLFIHVYSKLFNRKESDFVIYLMVSLAMSNLEFVLNEGRLPKRDELKDGIDLMYTAINQ
ncbi:TetR/AcrR family transcriptional regulator [Weissella paramesenteroides]|uniref:TetR/AcrR family transcriptional regulator n=1 Tax=Weissella paramesenteroides TaxID=1249 RepID=UPI003F743536